MYRLGVDLGGTNIVAGIVDENYKIISKSSVKTNAGRSADEIVDSIAHITKKVIDEAGIAILDVKSFGIGSPGDVNTQKGIVYSAGNLGFINVDLQRMLYERLGVNFFIANDANAAAYGEYIAGAGKGSENFVAITLGTGVGSGIIINRKIYTGSNFAGGELGHTVIDMNGEECVCGSRGCFEMYASATALVKQTKIAMKNDKNSIMWEIAEELESVNGITAFSAASQGDKSAQLVINKYTEYIAIGLINIIRSFQPEIICIGGGISKEKDNLIKPVLEHIKKYDKFQTMLKHTKICVARLQNDAGVIGAAFLDNIYK